MTYPDPVNKYKDFYDFIKDIDLLKTKYNGDFQDFIIAYVTSENIL